MLLLLLPLLIYEYLGGFQISQSSPSTTYLFLNVGKEVRDGGGVLFSLDFESIVHRGVPMTKGNTSDEFLFFSIGSIGVRLELRIVLL
jgi:hypothetical protein